MLRNIDIHMVSCTSKLRNIDMYMVSAWPTGSTPQGEACCINSSGVKLGGFISAWVNPLASGYAVKSGVQIWVWASIRLLIVIALEIVGRLVGVCQDSQQGRARHKCFMQFCWQVIRSQAWPTCTRDPFTSVTHLPA